MDYAKFVRKDMPLAVPTQKRPPGKYASHPYPIFLDESMAVFAALEGEGALIGKQIDNINLSAELSGDGELRSIFQEYTAKPDFAQMIASVEGSGLLIKKEPPQPYTTNDGFITQAQMQGTGTLKKVLLTYTVPIERMTLNARMQGTGEMI